jgi:hypothetical protein
MRVIPDMKTNLGLGLLSALAITGLVWIAGTRAQSAGGAPNSSLITTNWIGCLVVGKGDPFDKMARGAHPTTMDQVQIGLRSDGVVVWRDAGAR